MATKHDHDDALPESALGRRRFISLGAAALAAATTAMISDKTEAESNLGNFRSEDTTPAVTAVNVGTVPGDAADGSCGQAVWADSHHGPGVHGISRNSDGKSPFSGVGVFGQGPAKGVFGTSFETDGIGVGGDAPSGTGVKGTSQLGPGVHGISMNSDGKSPFSGVGVFGQGPAKGVFGTSSAPDGKGVGGDSKLGTGVHGSSESPNHRGVYGSHTNSGPGVEGSSESGPGVRGASRSQAGTTPYSGVGVWGEGPNKGVFGNGQGAGAIGVGGDSLQGTGVHGSSSSAEHRGVLGTHFNSGPGVEGTSVTGPGVQGESRSGPGVRGIAPADQPAVLAISAPYANGSAAGQSPDGGLALKVVGKAQFSTAGSGTFAAGEASAIVANPAVTASSHITITLTDDPGGGVFVQWVQRESGVGFSAFLSAKSKKGVSFTYFIVEP